MGHADPHDELFLALCIIGELDRFKCVDEYGGHFLKVLGHWVARGIFLFSPIVDICCPLQLDDLLLLLLVLMLKLIGHVSGKLVI